MSTIFASGGLDEDELALIARREAPIDGFGIGTSLTTSFDVPALDCAYKLQEYAGLPRRKRSTGKATWPGRKQVWRHYDADGRMQQDILSVEHDNQAGEPLIQAVMTRGTAPPPAANAGRNSISAPRAILSACLSPCAARSPGAILSSAGGGKTRTLAAEVDQRLAQQRGDRP